MEKLKFKTNINCGGCVAKVTPFLNAETSIDKWEIDVVSPEKILTIEMETIHPDIVLNVIKKAGFTIELFNE